MVSASCHLYTTWEINYMPKLTLERTKIHFGNDSQETFGGGTVNHIPSTKNIGDAYICHASNMKYISKYHMQDIS